MTLVGRPTEHSPAFSADRMFDNRPGTLWRTPDGVRYPQVVTLLLQGASVVECITVDPGVPRTPKLGPRDVIVEILPPGAGQNWLRVIEAKVGLGEITELPLPQPTEAVMVRVTFWSNHGGPYLALGELYILGAPSAHGAPRTSVNPEAGEVRVAGFYSLFVGMLFVLMDFRFHHFDVLPDWVGYSLEVHGLGLLAAAHPRFERARLCAQVQWVAATLDLVMAFGAALVVLSRGGTTLSDVFRELDQSKTVSTIAWVLDAVLVWQVCGAILDVALGLQDRLLAMAAARRRFLYVGVQGIVAAPLLLGALSTEWWTFGLTGIAVIAVVDLLALVLMLALLLRAARALQGGARSP